MVEIRTTAAFDAWLEELHDARAKSRVFARIDRLALGNAGDCKSVGSGVMEMRIHVGPGYRVYFVRRGTAVIVLLAGGDKSSQARDIKAVLELAQGV